jgi:RHS repeat-associated protein
MVARVRWTLALAAVLVLALQFLPAGLPFSPGAASASPASVSLFGSSDSPTVASSADPTSVEVGARFSSDMSGVVTGVRFYKGAGNTGPHTGSLWQADGTRLASVAFTSESPDGWQTASFADPVPISAGVTYVVSYSAPAGHYADDSGAFTTGRTSGILHVPAQGGMFTSAGGFPVQQTNDNYWVDVLVESGPFMTVVSPARNARYVPATTTAVVRFSTAITASSLYFVINGVSGTAAYDPNTRTATLTPSAPLPLGGTYVAVVNANTTAGAAIPPMRWSFTVDPPPAATSVFTAADQPSATSADDGNDIELGLTFSPVVAGSVTGVRFYQGSGNTGTHVGSLWSSAGQQLASATFSGESGSGWQAVSFGSPVRLTPGARYVVSYRAPSGHYAVTRQQFAAPLLRYPLSVPVNGGVFGAGGAFPTTTDQASNYWVDVAFQPDSAALAPPAPANPAPSITAVTAPGPTTAPATLSTSTTWGPSGSPYLVNSMTISVGVTLTLLPGTVVKMTGTLEDDGQILSLGTPGNPVIITSARDDSAMGDTNGDGSATVPARGDWTTIELRDSNTGPTAPVSVFDYTTIEYGGYSTLSCSYFPGAISPAGSRRVIITNSTFTHIMSAGVRTAVMANGYVGVYNSTFTDSGCGMGGIATSGPVDIEGNAFTSSLGEAVRFLSVSARMWFNIISSTMDAADGSGSMTRSEFDVEYNNFAGGTVYEETGMLRDYSNNWWGSVIGLLPTCMDPGIAAASHPPIKTTPSSSCPTGQQAVVGYQGSGTYTPALSGSPSILPAAAREPFAPTYGPVNLANGVLTYGASDLMVEDAGRTLTATRTYRSDHTDGPDAGPGWFTSYSQGLSSAVSGVATLSLGNGSTVDFRTDPGVGSVPTPGVTAAYASGGSGTTITTTAQDSYAFDSSGQLQSMALGDPGHQVAVTRADGKPSRITGVSGRYLNYTRSGGLVQAISDSNGRSVGFSYDGGRLAAVTGVDGQTESYTYNANGQLTQVTTPMGRVKLRMDYDSDGRVAWLEQEGIGRATFTYDNANARTLVNYPDGSQSEFDYDWAGRLVAQRTATPGTGTIAGTGTHAVYDMDGRPVVTISGVPADPEVGYGVPASFTGYSRTDDPIITTDPVGRTTVTTFNAQHKPLTATRLLSSSSSEVTSYTYDGNGRLASMTDPLGKVWHYTVNGRGQLTSRTDPLGRTATMTYADNGDVTTSADETGALTTVESDGLGRVSSIVDQLGRRTSYTYTAWDAPASVTKPAGGVTTLTYNNDRQPLTQADAVGGVTQTGYDSQGRPSTVTDPAGNTTTRSYDVAGRVVATTDPLGHVQRTAYGSAGWPVSTTDATGFTTTYVYDPAGRVIRTIDPLGEVTQTGYNRSNDVTARQTPNGATWSYTYDNAGRVTRVTTGRGGYSTIAYDLDDRPVSVTDANNFVSATSYDAIGRLKTTTDPLGTVTTYTYDDPTRSVTVTDALGTVSGTTRDYAGQIVSSTDGSGRVTTYEYNLDGMPTRQTAPGGGVTVTSYDLADRVLSTTDPTNRTTSSTLDALGRPTEIDGPGGSTEHYSYDAAGNPVSYTDPTGAVTHYTYDADNHPVQVTDALNASTTTGYDALGRVAAVLDPTGVAETIGYDPVGRIAVDADTTGASWQTSYDLNGNVTKTVDPAGVTQTYQYDTGDRLSSQYNSTNGYFSYTYDHDGRLTQRADPRTMSYSYDIRGRVIGQKDAYNNQTVLGYDGQGRITSSTPPSGHGQTWTYDNAGRLATAADGAGDTSAYAYDAAGRLQTVTLPKGGVYAYGYDAAGRATTATDPLNRVTGWGYDNDGRLTSTTKPSGAAITYGYDPVGDQTSVSATDVGTRHMTYDAAGRLTSASGNGSTLAYAYDNRGLLASSTDSRGQTTYGYDIAQRLDLRAAPGTVPTIFTYDPVTGTPQVLRGPFAINYTYNSAGQLTDTSGTTPSVLGGESRSYDANGRPTTSDLNGNPSYTVTYNADGLVASLKQSEPNNGAGNTTAFTYDSANRLATAALSRNNTLVSTTTYGWDADGNRTSVAVTGQAAVTTSFDLADEPVIASDGSTFGMDPDGNLTAVIGGPAPATYSYDALGEMTGAITATGNVSYGRDPLGRTASRSTISGTTTNFYGDSSSTLAAQRTTTGSLVNLVRDPRNMLQGLDPSGGAALRVRLSVHGDIDGVYSDTSSSLIWSAIYDPFGATTTAGTAPPVPLDFQGMGHDPATGLIDMGARSYDPRTGRFTSPDSIAGDPRSVVSLNRYLYGNASPLNFVDPDGHWPDFIDDARQDIDSFFGRAGDELNGGLQGMHDKFSQFDNAMGISPDALNVPTPRQIVAGAVALGATAAVETGCGLVDFSTAGLATPVCGAAAGATFGSVYNAMTCPTGISAWKCAGQGFVAGGTAGALFGGGDALGLGMIASGAGAGAGGDIVQQLLGKGTVDFHEVGAQALLGGTLGFAGGGLSRAAGADLPQVSAAATIDDASAATGLTGDVPPVPVGRSTADTVSGGSAIDDSPIAAAAADDAGPVTLKAESRQCVTANSFAGATPVLMANGLTKPIDEVKAGDQVAATDPQTGQTRAEYVTQVIVGTGDKKMVSVTVTDAATHAGSTIEATTNHPFWDQTTHSWTEAGQLKPGDHLLSPHGDSSVTVTAVRPHDEHTTVYNLTVAEAHTYYVVAGSAPLLVHNCDESFDNVALGTREHGLQGFADENGYAHFLNQTRDDALASVWDVANMHPDATIHVRLDGFDPLPGHQGPVTPADLFEAAYRNGGGNSWYTTEREMNILGRSVRLGNRSWDTIKFYLGGSRVTIPKPGYLGG